MSEMALNRCIQNIEGLEYETKSFFSLNLLPKKKIKTIQSLRFARRNLKNINYLLDLILVQEGFSIEECNEELKDRIEKVLTNLHEFARLLRSDLPNTLFYHYLYSFFFGKHYCSAVEKLEDLALFIDSFTQDDGDFLSSEELFNQI